jgi:hypothetical protein
MVLFLRDKSRQDVVEVEINFSKDKRDLRSSIDIEAYSEILLNNLGRGNEVIRDFIYIDQLRGWFWECYIPMTSSASQKDCVEIVRDRLLKIAQKYDLYYVED